MKLSLQIAVVAAVACLTAAKYESVHMSQVTGLTFYRDKYTTARRTSAMPQLQCVKGDACGDFTPSVVQCTRTGWDGFEAQWACTAELPEGMSLGSTIVNCEGYNGPEDEYILRGSCGLEYELRWTTGRPANWKNPDFQSRQQEYDRQQQRQRQQQQQEQQKHAHTDYYYNHNQAVKENSWGLGSWLMLGLIGWLLYKILKSMAAPPTETAGSTIYTRPPAAVHHNTAPAPPPPRPSAPHDAPYRNNDAYVHQHDDDSSWAKWQRNAVPEATRVYTSTAEEQRRAEQQGQGRFGFWSGAGLGGLAGYALGRGMGTRAQQQQQAPPAASQFERPYYTGPAPSAPTVGSLYNSDRRYSTGGSSTSYGSQEPAPAQQTTAATHTSTGYGTTKRR